MAAYLIFKFSFHIYIHSNQSNQSSPAVLLLYLPCLAVPQLQPLFDLSLKSLYFIAPSIVSVHLRHPLLPFLSPSVSATVFLTSLSCLLLSSAHKNAFTYHQPVQ